MTPSPLTPNATDLEPTAEVSLPGVFCAWFDDTNLAGGGDDGDPQCKATRLAYKNGHTHATASGSYHVTATDTVLRLLKEYAGYCLNSNVDEPDDDEMTAAGEVIERVAAARAKLREPQAPAPYSR